MFGHKNFTDECYNIRLCPTCNPIFYSGKISSQVKQGIWNSTVEYFVILQFTNGLPPCSSIKFIQLINL